MTSPRYRYGLFLRPPAKLASIQAQTHALLRAQFGLVAAGAFPPHVTILGHVATDASDNDMVAAAAAAVEGFGAVPVHNRGLAPYHGGICHDVGSLASGEPNPALLELFRAARKHLDPLRTPLGPAYRGGVKEEDEFYGHMSLAGHDLTRRPDLFAEVLRFLTDLDIGAPGDYVFDVVSLYRFETRTGWDGPWWETMTWTLLSSHRLP
ncbi:hypothetical protein [Kribbella sp. NPDC051770]|uniref:2'-5' RNA ligase family protein n=1 Tax=Kribbella sp. NPDC051770 TaxID=3155413 RepID=UPI00342A55E4